MIRIFLFIKLRIIFNILNVLYCYYVLLLHTLYNIILITNNLNPTYFVRPQ